MNQDAEKMLALVQLWQRQDAARRATDMDEMLSRHPRNERRNVLLGMYDEYLYKRYRGPYISPPFRLQPRFYPCDFIAAIERLDQSQSS